MESKTCKKVNLLETAWFIKELVSKIIRIFSKIDRLLGENFLHQVMFGVQINLLDKTDDKAGKAQLVKVTTDNSRRGLQNLVLP